MAIDLQDFKPTKYPNLFKSKEEHKTKGYRFLMWSKIDRKLYKKILGYSVEDRLTEYQANERLNVLIAQIKDGYTPTKINLNKLHDLYFESENETDWNTKKKSIYNLYIQKSLGDKVIETIKEMHVKRILSSMDKQGLSPRTQKSVLEVLKPMFSFATANKMLKDNPVENITVKIPSQKKIVTNATELFQRVYFSINAYYHDNPYYRALFLFGFTGRRKGEILNLKWENIDFINAYYWIEDTKNGDKQKYELPPYLIEPLEAIKDNRVGLVFKSLVTGEKIINTDRQMRQLKKFIGIDNLSLHYMRNILVSSLAEQGIEAINLSGLLGHKDVNTINKYLSVNHYKSSQLGFKKIDIILDVEVL
jgi:integrase